MKPWLAALAFLAGVVGSLYSLATMAGPHGHDPRLLVLHITSYGFILAGFDYLVRKNKNA